MARQASLLANLLFGLIRWKQFWCQRFASSRSSGRVVFGEIGENFILGLRI